MTTLIGIPGALRRESTNRKLAREAARLFEADTYVEADLRLPLFDQDLEDEAGIPAAVMHLADQILGADAVVISTPEYNKALPGVLKNALDWLSRTGKAPLKDKPTAIVSAAAGRAGGERSQYSLRLCLAPFRPRLIQGPEVMIAASGEAFDENGHLKDENAQKFLRGLMDELRAML